MNKLNQLKRVLNGLNLLRKDTKYMVSMETYHNMGNVLIRTYTALHQSVSEIVDDVFVNALTIDLPEDADDRQKVTQVAVLAGQLLAFLEAYYEEVRDVDTDDNVLTEEERINRRFNELMDDK